MISVLKWFKIRCRGGNCKKKNLSVCWKSEKQGHHSIISSSMLLQCGENQQEAHIYNIPRDSECSMRRGWFIERDTGSRQREHLNIKLITLCFMIQCGERWRRAEEDRSEEEGKEEEDEQKPSEAPVIKAALTTLWCQDSELMWRFLSSGHLKEKLSPSSRHLHKQQTWNCVCLSINTTLWSRLSNCRILMEETLIIRRHFTRLWHHHVTSWLSKTKAPDQQISLTLRKTLFIYNELQGFLIASQKAVWYKRTTIFVPGKHEISSAAAQTIPRFAAN